MMIMPKCTGLVEFAVLNNLKVVINMVLINSHFFLSPKNGTNSVSMATICSMSPHIVIPGQMYIKNELKWMKSRIITRSGPFLFFHSSPGIIHISTLHKHAYAIYCSSEGCENNKKKVEQIHLINKDLLMTAALHFLLIRGS